MSASDAAIPTLESSGSARTYRILEHAFTVRTNSPAIQGYVASVLARYTTDDDASAAGVAYEILDLGPGEKVSRYRLLVRGSWVNGSGDPSHVLDDLFSHINLDTIDARPDLVMVHAGSVVTPGGAGVVIPASAGSGKTTLVAGLLRAGFGYLSDEAAVLDPETARLHPYPKNLTLKARVRERFPEARPADDHLRFAGDKWQADPEGIRAGALAPPCDVGFVIPHRHEAGASTRVQPLTPAEACVELGRNLMHARRDGTRALPILARACERARAWRLVSGDLDEAVGVVAELTEA
jgi:hypothetical protein